jgi:hypothetical protein
MLHCTVNTEHRSLAELARSYFERTKIPKMETDMETEAAAPVVAGWWFLFSRPIWVGGTELSRVNFKKI